MLLMLICHTLSRALGFRYREAHAYYRMLDVGGAFWLIVPFAGLYYGVAALVDWLLPTNSASLDSTLGFGLGVLAFGVITLWMPFIEHLSLTQPHELTLAQRRWVVYLARALPYLYGVVGTALGVVVGHSIAVAIGIVLVRVNDLVLHNTPLIGPPWLANGWMALWQIGGVGMVLRMGQRDTEWGLSAWRTAGELDLHQNFGTRLFDALDRTIGRAVLGFLKAGTIGGF